MNVEISLRADGVRITMLAEPVDARGAHIYSVSLEPEAQLVFPIVTRTRCRIPHGDLLALAAYLRDHVQQVETGSAPESPPFVTYDLDIEVTGLGGFKSSRTDGMFSLRWMLNAYERASGGHLVRCGFEMSVRVAEVLAFCEKVDGIPG